MAKKTPLNNKQYSINTENMNIHKRPPLFYKQDNGVYFIHPASTVDAKATLSFMEPSKLFWHFSIQEGSPSGRILFTILKNGEELNKFTVDTK